MRSWLGRASSDFRAPPQGRASPSIRRAASNKERRRSGMKSMAGERSSLPPAPMLDRLSSTSLTPDLRTPPRQTAAYDGDVSSCDTSESRRTPDATRTPVASSATPGRRHTVPLADRAWLTDVKLTIGAGSASAPEPPPTPVQEVVRVSCCCFAWTRSRRRDASRCAEPPRAVPMQPVAARHPDRRGSARRAHRAGGDRRASAPPAPPLRGSWA